MLLRELITAVDDKTLSQEQLEAYGDQLSTLFAKMQLEMSDWEKEEALFMHDKGEDQSVADRKIQWKATTAGQRLIVLKRYALATKEMINSLKSRVFRLIK